MRSHGWPFITSLLPTQVKPIQNLNGEGNTIGKALFLSETWVQRSIRKSKTILALFVLEKGEDKTHLHRLAQPLIYEFGNVFPNELPPRLPPVRGI